MTDQKQRARGAVRNALKAGILVRPNACPKCGGPDRLRTDGRSTIHAHHHNGYDDALDVVWLCVGCHFKEDRRPAGVKNGKAKLSESQVADIRRRYKPGATWWNPHGGAKYLAREYGVNERTIKRIAFGETWIDAALSTPLASEGGAK